MTEPVVGIESHPVRYCNACMLAESGRKTVATHVAQDVDGMQWYVCDEHRSEERVVAEETVQEFWQKVFQSLAPKKV